MTGELVYQPEFGQIEGRLRPFSKIGFSDIQSSRGGRIGYLFLIPPGVKVTRLETGGRPFESQAISVPPAPQ